MDKKMINLIALALQAGGFAPALVAYFLLPGHADVFQLAFTVHLIGDVLSFLTNR